MKLTPTEKKNLVIKETRNGRGIFGQRAFAPEEIVFEVRGVFITGDVDEDIEESVRDNAYRYDADRYISPQGRIGDMLNHSCNPNAKVSKEGDKLLVRAIKHIPIGKEIVIDYATITGADDIWSMKCNCGSTKCRGKIVPFKQLPKALRDTYKKQGIVPAHIIAI